MKTIGLVMAKPPGYSEIFFNLKIKGLQDQGCKIIIFTGAKKIGTTFFKHVISFPTERIDLFKRPGTFFKLIYFILFKSLRPAIRFFKLEKKDGSSTFQCFKLLYFNAHILPYKLDCLHFEFATMALLRENVAKALGATMSVSVRGYDIGIYPLKHPGCYNKLWSKIDKLHTISDHLYELCLSSGLNKQMPVKKINPAIEIDKIKLKNDIGSFHRPLKLLTVARLHWIKGLIYSLEAVKILKENQINFIYHIIGEGSLFESLVFALHQLGLEDQVFLEGKKSHNDVLDFMSGSDIYLQPSLQEGFCNSVLEAQAFGLQCIVTDAEGLSENVINNKTGWVIPKRDPNALFRKIVEVINLPANTRKDISLYARQRIDKEFNMKKQITEFIEFFNS